MKAIYILKFENIARKRILWTKNTSCLTIFYLRTFGENTIQSCEYPLVPLPRK